MRFFADGPDIPDDLLYARDEGEVLFFCGAGISMQEAGGLSFPELAKRVISSLGSSASSPARQLLEISDKIETPPGVGGIPPADRIFALLEQEFAVEDIRSDVSQAVKPNSNPGLDPHKSLFNLSKMPNGRHRLITTNFDRLFQLAAPDIPEISPPDLPDPRRDEWEGIIHLHGMVNPDYSDAASKEFILSSADFGRAYLSDGWATAFMKTLVERYKIVFVGYSADDPPIQYLLEGLKGSTKTRGLYTFQQGKEDEASALWQDKGVTAISHQDFPSLWESLKAWGERANDPHEWQKSIISDKALKKPRELDPYERGQVAHVVSSTSGAKKFAGHATPPSAEWLCVFDPFIRYSNQNYLHDLFEEILDPLAIFNNFCLDSDPRPLPEDNSQKHLIPSNVWSAFEETSNNKQNLFISLRNKGNNLPARLQSLAYWIGRVVNQNITVWWASRQNWLHSELTNNITHNIDGNMESPIRQAWHLLLSSKSDSSDENCNSKFWELYYFSKKEGWTSWLQREFENLKRPRISVGSKRKIPLDDTKNHQDLVSAKVIYPNHPTEMKIPKKFLVRYIRVIRSYLESAEDLEIDNQGYFDPRLHPIVEYDDPASIPDNEEENISSLIRHYANELKQLYEHNSEAARCEWRKWPDSEDKIFRNLYVWVTGQAGLTSQQEASDIILNLSNDVFWDIQIQHDLLVSLNTRWSEFDEETREKIENKILSGPKRYKGIDDQQYKEYRTCQILNRLEWLKKEKLTVSFDLETKRLELRKITPEWTPEYALDNTYRSSSRGGCVATDTDITELFGIPIDKILEKSDDISRKSPDFLIERRPFKGLSKEYPVKALAALIYAAKRGETRRQYWSEFLCNEARRTDKLRLKILIVERIYSLSEEVFNTSIDSIASWMEQHGRALAIDAKKSYLKLWERIVKSVLISFAESETLVVDKKQENWLFKSINSPIGKMTVLLIDEILNKTIDEEWHTRANCLISAKNDALCCVMAIFGTKLGRIYSIDKQWTDEHIISQIEQNPNSESSRAFISSACQYTSWNHDLFARLKIILTDLVSQKNHKNYGIVMRLLFRGWISLNQEGDRLVNNEELRDFLIKTDDKGRITIINSVKIWAKEKQKWTEVIEFLNKVWPRQLITRTQALSEELIEIALLADDKMPDIVQLISPRLTIIKNSLKIANCFSRLDDTIILKFPKEIFKLLQVIIPSDIQDIFYGYKIGELIDKLSNIECIKSDPKFTELRRKMRP
ncbi:SIR2 family protein [Zymomonas mobilis]|uniref:Uncharacterized protein n=3 Tax=Zymomonas mobilis TaxID=542 RepID=A0A0H3G0N1_ZYMMA|nr:SIR2 family protein [Zymomonas mobilis]AEH63586.1 conserved hypothetical protein [Zymomonas mobilis subsp. mobilis ATCC 10988]TQL24904.1 SIR2-like protein [Zymomonas mobilis]